MNEQEKDRRNKLAQIRTLGATGYDNGIFPSRVNFVRSNYKSDFGKDGGTEFTVAGRVKLRRGMGGLSFITLWNDGEEIQIAFDKKRLDPKYFAISKLLDLGDIITVTGNLGATQTGEITVWANSLTISAKALTSPPSKLEGIVDQELKFRQRHVSLWTDAYAHNLAYLRPAIIREIRNYMHYHDFIEVETPILQTQHGGANAKPFRTHHNALNMDLSLRIAPELYLKKCLIGGLNRVFEIGKNFRNEGISTRHNPEFTVLEAYEAFGNAKSMMTFLENMISEVVQKIHGTTKIKIGGGDSPEVEIDFAQPFTIVNFSHLLDSRSGDLMKIYEEEIEPIFIQPTFVTNFPAKEIPLCKSIGEFADNFELVINGQEIGPGYSEQNDPDQQLVAFQNQVGEDGMVADHEFIDALKCGMPPAGGFGIGIDRLVAILAGGQSNIREVILFPLMKPKEI